MIDFFAAARKAHPAAFALILTQRNTVEVAKMLEDKGFGKEDYYVGSVTPGELPKYLSAADVAISFIKACYSKLSSSPTKIGEYLACGLPIIANRGVGDVDAVMEDNGVGVLLDSFSEEAFLDAIEKARDLSGAADKCRETARREFDLMSVGGNRYRRIYSRLLEAEDAG